ncbi:hypothetical protein LTR53_003734 [Teratosphaeriaceae sp. CCFEE 6253]|nr:hypothetical protein LTR53_003734 [Teratosphaeriaceae sp. CCFEE 6253]
MHQHRVSVDFKVLEDIVKHVRSKSDLAADTSTSHQPPLLVAQGRVSATNFVLLPTYDHGHPVGVKVVTSSELSEAVDGLIADERDRMLTSPGTKRDSSTGATPDRDLEESYEPEDDSAYEPELQPDLAQPRDVSVPPPIAEVKLFSGGGFPTGRHTHSANDRRDSALFSSDRRPSKPDLLPQTRSQLGYGAVASKRAAVTASLEAPRYVKAPSGHDHSLKDHAQGFLGGDGDQYVRLPPLSDSDVAACRHPGEWKALVYGKDVLEDCYFEQHGTCKTRTECTVMFDCSRYRVLLCPPCHRKLTGTTDRQHQVEHAQETFGLDAAQPQLSGGDRASDMASHELAGETDPKETPNVKPVQSDDPAIRNLEGRLNSLLAQHEQLSRREAYRLPKVVEKILSTKRELDHAMNVSDSVPEQIEKLRKHIVSLTRTLNGSTRLEAGRAKKLKADLKRSKIAVEQLTVIDGLARDSVGPSSVVNSGKRKRAEDDEGDAGKSANLSVGSPG